MAPRMPLVSLLTAPLLALVSAQALIIESYDAAGNTCPPLAAPSVIVQPTYYQTYIESVGQIITVNGGEVIINNAPTNFISTYIGTQTVIETVISNVVTTATVDQNGSTIGPGLGSTTISPSASGNPSTTGIQPTGSSGGSVGPSGPTPTGNVTTSAVSIFSTSQGQDPLTLLANFPCCASANY